MISEFKEFLEKFNVIPVAVGLVLALAVLPLVEAVVNFVMSIVGALAGGEVNFDDLTFSLRDGSVPYGALITAIITFLMIAFVVFMIVKALNKAGAQTALNATPDQALLTEIRDLLKSGR